MGQVRFEKADPKLPVNKGGKRWLHRASGKKMRKDGSYELVAPVFFYPGEEYPVTDYEAEWLARKLPQCFSVVEKKPAKPKKSESKSEGEE